MILWTNLLGKGKVYMPANEVTLVTPWGVREKLQAEEDLSVGLEGLWDQGHLAPPTGALKGLEPFVEGPGEQTKKSEISAILHSFFAFLVWGKKVILPPTSGLVHQSFEPKDPPQNPHQNGMFREKCGRIKNMPQTYFSPQTNWPANSTDA